MALRIGDLSEATSFVGTDVFELSLAGSAGSRRVTGANLRKQLFAGGTGFTATDPLTAGNTTITGTLSVTGATTLAALTATTGNFSSGLASGISPIAQGGTLYLSHASNPYIRWDWVNVTSRNGYLEATGDILRLNFTGGGLIQQWNVQTGAVTFAAGITATTGTFSNYVHVSSAQPLIAMTESGVAADNGKWQWTADAESLVLRTINDAETTTGNIMTVQRTGTTVDSIAFGAALTATTGTFSGAVSGASFTTAGNFNTTGGSLVFGTNGYIQPISDGILNLSNTAGNGFSRLQFGGTTNAFPALKRSAAVLHCRLADDSGYASFLAENIQANGAVTGNAFAGTTWTGTGLIQTTITTEQLRLRYDASNYLSVTVDATGNVNMLATGTARVMTLSAHVKIGEAADNVAFFGTAPTGKKTVSGSRGGNAALASLLTQLAAYGLITDSTTA